MTHTFSRLTLSALLSAALFVGVAGAQDVNSAQVATDTVIVQTGDTAYSLARRAGLSLPDFLALNNLNSPDLKIGQSVVMRAGISHVVQAGETLYSLSRRYGVSVDAIQAANTLPEDAVIAVGQSIRIPMGSNIPTQPTMTASVSTPVVVNAPAPVAVAQPLVVAPGLGNNWRENAMALVGVPYVWGGTARNGTDCSGFVLQVFTPLGVKLPRVSADQARSGVAVALNQLLPGDLLFFDTVGAGRVTHVGIFLGNDTFINANSYEGKVTVNRFQADKYWAPRFTNARRVLPGNILASQP